MAETWIIRRATSLVKDSLGSAVSNFRRLVAWRKKSLEGKSSKLMMPRMMAKLRSILDSRSAVTAVTKRSSGRLVGVCWKTLALLQGWTMP